MEKQAVLRGFDKKIFNKGKVELWDLFRTKQNVMSKTV